VAPARGVATAPKRDVVGTALAREIDAVLAIAAKKDARFGEKQRGCRGVDERASAVRGRGRVDVDVDARTRRGRVRGTDGAATANRD